MDRTPTVVVSRARHHDVTGVDVLFFLSISFIIGSFLIVISLR